MGIFGIKDNLLMDYWLNIKQSWAESTTIIYYNIWEIFGLFAEMKDLKIYHDVFVKDSSFFCLDFCYNIFNFL